MKILAASALLLSASLALAQPSVPSAVTSGTTTTTAASISVPTAKPNEVSGAIVSFNATTAALVVQVPDLTAPVTYRTTTDTSLVDYANKPITVGYLQAGRPVTVFFDPANPTTASKVILQQYARPATP